MTIPRPSETLLVEPDASRDLANASDGGARNDEDEEGKGGQA